MKKIPVRQLSSVHQELPSHERFSIRRVEDIVLPDEERKTIQHLHKHDFFFILALQNGKGAHEVDFVSYNLHNNSIFFLRPGQAHKLDLKPGSTGFIIEFNAAFCHPNNKSSGQRLRRASNKNYCKPEIQRFNKLLTILSDIFIEYTNREDGYRDIIRASLDIFFIEFMRESHNPNDPKIISNLYAQDRFEEFLELLDKHIVTHKQVAQYTDLMNLSAYQLNEITKSSVGKTASELINEHILLEAKRYLLATPNQVKDIADQLGFEDNSYFIRFFKKHIGHSPEAFRKSFK